MDVDGTKVRDIRTRQQFRAALKRHRVLRAFVDTDNDIIIAWDSETLVHPDVRSATGDFGIPVQLDATSISLRPHGLSLPYIKQMYHELIHAPIIKRIYGSIPPIYIDDEYADKSELSNLGRLDEADEAYDHWTNHWVSY